MKKNKDTLAIILICLFVLLSIFFGYKQVAKNWDGIRVDFPSFYYGADMAFKGGSPYNKTTWKSVKAQNLPNQDLYPYLNIPPSLILFYPLTLFEIQVAQSIVFIVNLLAVFVFFYLIFYKILNKSFLDPMVPIGGIYILLFPPVRETISYGQVNLIVIILICIFWWAIKDNKSGLTTSLPLALAILLKVYPGIFLLYLFIKRKFKSILMVVGILVLFVLAAYLVLPQEVWSDWYASVGRIKYGGVFGDKIPSWKVGNQSLNGFISRFFMGARNREIVSMSDYIYQLKWRYKWIASAAMGYLSVGFIVLVWLFLASKNKIYAGKEIDTDLYLSLLLLTMFMAAPISWDHHLVFILPAIFVLLDHYITNQTLNVSFFMIIIFSVILAIDIDLRDPIFQRGVLGIFASSHFMAVFGLWMINTITIYKSSQEKKAAVV